MQVAEFVPTKTRDKCRNHYQQQYIQCPTTGPLPDPETIQVARTLPMH